MDSVQDIPDAEDKLMCLHTAASKIIYRIFQSAMPMVQNILRMCADDTDQQDTSYPYCLCKTKQPGAVMVFCDNTNCPRGVWFHIECLHMEDDIPECAWYCSTSCEEDVKKKSRKKTTTANTLTDLKLHYALLMMGKRTFPVVKERSPQRELAVNGSVSPRLQKCLVRNGP